MMFTDYLMIMINKILEIIIEIIITAKQELFWVLIIESLKQMENGKICKITICKLINMKEMRLQNIW